MYMQEKMRTMVAMASLDREKCSDNAKERAKPCKGLKEQRRCAVLLRKYHMTDEVMSLLSTWERG